jgi:hypothetical protein
MDMESCDGCVWFRNGKNPEDGAWVADACQKCVRTSWMTSVGEDDWTDNWCPKGALIVKDERRGIGPGKVRCLRVFDEWKGSRLFSWRTGKVGRRRRRGLR